MFWDCNAISLQEERGIHPQWAQLGKGVMWLFTRYLFMEFITSSLILLIEQLVNLVHDQVTPVHVLEHFGQSPFLRMRCFLQESEIVL